MKRFWRSVPGKTTLFLALLLCLCVAACGVVGAIGMLELQVYERPQSDAERDVVGLQVYSYAYNYARQVLACGPTVEPPPVAMQVTDENGEVLCATSGFLREKSRDDLTCYTFALEVERTGDKITEVYWAFDGGLHAGMGSTCTMTVYADGESLLSTSQRMELTMIRAMYCVKYAIYPVTAAAILLSVLLFVALMSVSGRRPDSDELVPGWLEAVPFDVMLALFCVAALLFVVVLDETGDWGGGFVILLVSGCVAFACLALGLCMSFAGRVKRDALIKNTLLYRLFALTVRFVRSFFRMLRKLPAVKWTALIAVAVSGLELLVLYLARYDSDNYLIFWMVEKAVLIPLVLLTAYSLRRLYRGGARLAEGNFEEKIDTKHLYGEFLAHAEHLNGLSDGMTKAVEQRMRSERMKTELITNVSHDLKTPLTSVINYADLICREDSGNPKIAEYADVLQRQSGKLRRLIDDLVEASRAATGDLDMDMQPCDACYFISQADGEYEEKLRSAGLTLVTKAPETEVRILADSRRMWRVFDNLMGNIAKYAQSGTRVFLTLTAEDGRAVVTFRNTSRDALDASAEELMERFVRGDSSRSTEGNGLGLSIARSLTELQNGTFDLSVDGDLFKVTLTFPIIR